MTYEDVKSAFIISIAIALIALSVASCARNREADYWIAVGEVTKETMEERR